MGQRQEGEKVGKDKMEKTQQLRFLLAPQECHQQPERPVERGRSPDQEAGGGITPTSWPGNQESSPAGVRSTERARREAASPTQERTLLPL